MTSAVINQHGYITVGVNGEGRGGGEAQDVEDLMGQITREQPSPSEEGLGRSFTCTHRSSNGGMRDREKTMEGGEGTWVGGRHLRLVQVIICRGASCSVCTKRPVKLPLVARSSDPPVKRQIVQAPPAPVAFYAATTASTSWKFMLAYSRKLGGMEGGKEERREGGNVRNLPLLTIRETIHTY